MKDNLYLFIDIDDVLVNSSPLIQKQVEKYTPYAKNVLTMYEQLNRNCKFYAKEVEKECKTAYQEKRLPKLNLFPNFDNFDYEIDKEFNFDNLNNSQITHIYLDPVDFAKYFIKVANMLLSQFLEERDIFLEIDNLAYGKDKNYDYEEELVTLDFFDKLLKENRKALVNINHFCYGEIKKIVEAAKKDNAIPEFGDLIKMDSNDIIRTNDVTEKSSKEDVLYNKPIKEVGMCLDYEEHLEDIVKNFSLMQNASRELLDYDIIYQSENVNVDALKSVRDLLNTGMFKGAYCITHHNGLREKKAKQSLVNEILPGVGFIELRFHDSEHNLRRRKRSSKMHCVEKMNIGSNENFILLDDSKDNCKDWQENGGFPILYRKLTDAELIKNEKEDTGFIRVTEFNSDELIGIIENYRKSKQKTLI